MDKCKIRYQISSLQPCSFLNDILILIAIFFTILLLYLFQIRNIDISFLKLNNLHEYMLLLLKKVFVLVSMWSKLVTINLLSITFKYF